MAENKSTDTFEEVEVEDEVITLTDEEGNDVDFYEVATLDYQEKWYIFLEPVEPLEGFEDGDLLIFELGEDENKEETFIPIEDEALLNTLFAEFQKLVEEDEENGEN